MQRTKGFLDLTKDNSICYNNNIRTVSAVKNSKRGGNMEFDEKQKHEDLKKKLKIIGFCLLICGAVCAIVGFVDFFMTFGNGGGMPKLFFLCFIGLPLIGVGAGILTFGFRREIMRYTKNESVPVINEAGKEIAPAVKDIASAVKDGLNEKAATVVCPACKKENDADSKFCKSCGAPLTRTCPYCGSKIDGDAEFCDECGKKINE